MKTRIHHTCINADPFDWYVDFFRTVFGMEIERTRGEAPARQVWFSEGIQLDEVPGAADPGGIYSHISIGVDDIPGTARRAIDFGCAPLAKGSHWFALPNGVQMELKPYR